MKVGLLHKNSLFGKVGLGSFFIPEYQAVYNNWIEKPSDIVAAAQNAMVKGWVNDGVYVTKDIIHVYAAHTNNNGEAQTNWKNPGVHDAVLVNAPSFTPFEGFKVDGATQHVETYNPTTSGVNLTQDSLGMSIYVRDNITETKCDIGGFTSSPDVALFIYTRTLSGGAYLVRANDFTSFEPLNADTLGMHILTRTAFNFRGVYKNKVLIGSDAILSTGLVNFNIPVGARYENGVIGSRASKQYAYVALGGGLTQTLVDNETNPLEVYMDFNGKGVIP